MYALYFQHEVPTMAEIDKPSLILDALQSLLEEKTLQNISVSEIAKRAGIGKGSIYYYYPSKDAILDALIMRSYKVPLETAKRLAMQTEVPPFTRLAMVFQSCQSVSAAFIQKSRILDPSFQNVSSTQEITFLHQKYVNYMITELHPALTAIIRQGIQRGEIRFDNPEALSEIVLIVLIIKLDNTIIPSSAEDIENTVKGLIRLLEKGADIPAGTLQYLSPVTIHNQ